MTKEFNAVDGADMVNMVYNATPPVLSVPGTLVPLQADSSGNLKIAAPSSGLAIVAKHGTKVFTTASISGSAGLILAANANRIKAVIVNNSSGTVMYVGNSASVTTGNGLPLGAGQSIEDSSSTDAWYGITSSATVDVRVCEVS